VEMDTTLAKMHHHVFPTVEDDFFWLFTRIRMFIKEKY